MEWRMSDINCIPISDQLAHTLVTWVWKPIIRELSVVNVRGLSGLLMMSVVDTEIWYNRPFIGYSGERSRNCNAGNTLSWRYPERLVISSMSPRQACFGYRLSSVNCSGRHRRPFSWKHNAITVLNVINQSHKSFPIILCDRLLESVLYGKQYACSIPTRVNDIYNPLTTTFSFQSIT